MLIKEARASIVSSLDNVDCHMEFGTDLLWWSNMLKKRGLFVNPALDPNLQDTSGASYVIIRRTSTNRMIGTLAWHCYETDDAVSDMESGALFYAPGPERDRFAGYRSGIGGALKLAGKIACRGGCHAFEKGSKVSWWLTTVGLLAGLEADANWQIGHTWEKVGHGALATRQFGYWNAWRLRPFLWHWLGREIELTLVFMSRDQAADCLDRRCRFLQTSEGNDLSSIVRAYSDAHRSDYRTIDGLIASGPKERSFDRRELVDA